MKVVRAATRSQSFERSAQPTARSWSVLKLWHGGAMKPSGGIQGPFTFFNRAQAGGRYPKITLKTGTMEYYITQGSFYCNGDLLSAGDWIMFAAPESMEWSTDTGGEFLLVLRGELDWAED